MTTPNSGAGLQFERAEFTTPGTGEIACAACGKRIQAEYYQVNDQIACDRCRRVAEAPPAGSRVGRLAKAVLYGTVAGAVGSGIYYGVRALTGYEFGLIAVVVGVMVGGAVRAGSGGRGGWRYQTIAMFLTYASIVSTYIPDIYKGIKENVEQERATAKASPVAGAPSEEAVSSVPASAPEASAASATSTPAATVDAEPPSAGVAALFLVAGVAILLAIAFVAPFLMGFQNIIGIVIIGIGLYEAWKMNKRAVTTVTGPYRVAAEASRSDPNG